jgi:hypothetical protein
VPGLRIGALPASANGSLVVRYMACRRIAFGFRSVQLRVRAARMPAGSHSRAGAGRNEASSTSVSNRQLEPFDQGWIDFGRFFHGDAQRPELRLKFQVEPPMLKIKHFCEQRIFIGAGDEESCLADIVTRVREDDLVRRSVSLWQGRQFFGVRSLYGLVAISINYPDWRSNLSKVVRRKVRLGSHIVVIAARKPDI